MARRIVEMMPAHTVYVEPFCGSCAVLFKKGTPPVSNGDHYREVINDTNGAVVDVFRAMRDMPDDLQRRVDLMPYSQEEHRRAYRVMIGDEEASCEAERAALLYLLLCGSGPFGLSSTQVSSNKKENHARTFRNRSARMPAMLARMSAAYIQSIDAVECIKKWDSPQTLFYCDPPYLDTSQAHYGGFGGDDLNALLCALNEAQGAFILSGYANEITNDFARDNRWGVSSHEASSSAYLGAGGKRRKRIEVLWYRARKCDPQGAALMALEAVDATGYFGGNLAARSAEVEG